MKLTTRILALVTVIGALTVPLSAHARNNNQMQQMLILNNVNTQEQNLSNQINAYVASGQLTPQQGAAFSSELSQLSSQAMMGGSNSMVALNEINSLSAQVTASLHTPYQNQYVYGAATNPYGATANPYVYGAATRAYASGAPGFYNNWRSSLSTQQNALRNAELQAGRNAVSEQNLINKNAGNAWNHEQVNQVHAAEAEHHYNEQLNNVHNQAEKDNFKHNH
jgi:hypothetical protein